MEAPSSAPSRWRIGTFMVLIAIAAFVAGAVTWHVFTGRILAYGTTANFIADATVDLAILDALESGSSAQARSILTTRLKSDVIGLEAQSDYMTDEQRAASDKLKSRAASYTDASH